MNVKILKRIELLESKMKKTNSPPELVMIHYDDVKKEWIITEHYSGGTGKNAKYRTKEGRAATLQEICFAPELHSRIILETFGNPDPAIYENFYAFDIDDLRKDLEEGDTGAIFIESISDPGEGVTVEIKVGCRELKKKGA